MCDLNLAEFLDKYVSAYPIRKGKGDDGSPEMGVWYQLQQA